MIKDIREKEAKILAVGNHTGIIQSILDFDYAAGKGSPSIVAIISAGRKTQKFFWGDGEILIPVHKDIEAVKKALFEPDWLLCITSPSSTPRIVEAFFTAFPHAHGAHLFAEGISERDALYLVEKYGQEKLILGPSGVGLCIPGCMKLGAIGGILGERVAQLGVSSGFTAVICSSGGMVNEIMYQVVAKGGGISFAACYGGDRFPITSPLQWLLQAQNDPQTKEIVYFGELGGSDEFLLRDAIKDKLITKPVFAYIAGRFESKDESIQFGHAKALAKAESETALAKMKALEAVGVNVSETFNDFMQVLSSLSRETTTINKARNWLERPPHISPTIFSAPKYKESTAKSFTESILQRILSRETVSPELVTFCDLVFTELIDHGPHVSGAVNTMITARAGRDLSSALATGVLTVGDRFGGAINESAKIWQEAISRETSADQLVTDYSKQRDYILGIGHRKYSVYKPDPRVQALISHAKGVLRETPHLDFAMAVEAITSKKRANLILNVDGAVSAIFLDFLTINEAFTLEEVSELIEIEFFNSLFLIPRSVGFVGNYLDQKRIDEGLFRLDEEDTYNF
jgi:ATP citrate (pro-S)-lyase